MAEAKVNWMGEGADKRQVGVPVPMGQMKLANAAGTGSLEIVERDGEPVVIVDGSHIIRHSTLVRQLADAVKT